MNRQRVAVGEARNVPAVFGLQGDDGSTTGQLRLADGMGAPYRPTEINTEPSGPYTVPCRIPSTVSATSTSPSLELAMAAAAAAPAQRGAGRSHR